MSKTITGAMPIRTVGLTPGHRWCGGLRSVKPAVNNGKGEHGLVHGPNSLNATYIHPGRISDRPRKLAKNLRNGHLVTRPGHERKTTSSYYTHSQLIKCVLDCALDPLVDEALSKPDPEKALLGLKLCDPACGSGHFLLAAAERMAKHLARLRTGDDEPSLSAIQHAKRDIIGRCIYGVDLNPMAAELC